MRTLSLLFLLYAVLLVFVCPWNSGRAETLSELLASIRRQGVRSESLLKDADNLIQRYRNLEGRMLNQAEAQSVLDGEYNVFNTQAESTRTWISQLSQPLTTPDRDTNMEEMKSKAQVSESGV